MTMDIFDYIINGKEYLVWESLGKSFDKYLEDDKDEYYIIIQNIVLLDIWEIRKLLSKYNIKEIFDLGNCYLGGGNERFTFWHIVKEEVSNVKTAVYYGSAHQYRDEKLLMNTRKLPQDYYDEYIDYIFHLNKWIDTGDIPDYKGQCEFNEIPIKEFDKERPYASFYSKKYSAMRKELRESEVKPLDEVAEIIDCYVSPDEKEKAFMLDWQKDFSYPFIPEMASIELVKSTVKLKKGDIVINRGGGKALLIDKEPDFDLYGPFGYVILRAKVFTPEYLYLYLTSKVFNRLCNAIRIPNGKLGISAGPFEELPVIVPHEEESFYIEQFKKIANPYDRYYSKIDSHNTSSGIENDLLNELIDSIKLNNEELIKKQINEDLEELQICYKNKAYKATLILAGSILEAFLLDWISEIHGVNYFEDENQPRKPHYIPLNGEYVIEEDSEGNIIYTDKRADLADYIDEIKQLKRPDWMQQAEGAHKIRKKRNLVHAKLCLRESAAIDEEMCKKVIEYLQEVIESRNNN